MSRSFAAAAVVMLLGGPALADPHAEMAAALAAQADLHPAPPKLPATASQAARRAQDTTAFGKKGHAESGEHGNSDAARAAHQAQGQGASQAGTAAHGAQAASEAAAGQARAAAAKAAHGHPQH